MNRNLKRFLILISSVFLVLTLYGIVKESITVKKGDINKFEELVQEKKIKSIIVYEDVNKLRYTTNKDKIYETKILRNYFQIKPELLETINKNEVELKVSKSINAMATIMNIIYLAVFIIIFMYLYKMMVGMSKVKLDSISNEKTKFEDIGGLDNVKKELRTLIAYLKDPDKLREYVDKIPKGILFEGDPGNGKTLLARVIAGESDTPFFYISGADIEGSFVAQGAGRVASIFKEVKKSALENGKAILFIDELDSIGIKREKRTVSETNQTLNKILTELDGFNENENILVIGATNLASHLDSALVRSGRFDRIIKIPMPSYTDRKKILELYLNKKLNILDEKVLELNYLDVLSKQTEGFSGADLERLVNDSALLAFEEGGNITIKLLRESYLRIVMGLPSDNELSEEDEKIIAYHEAAHAIVSMSTSSLGVRAVSYGTIKPYGNSGGHVSIVDNSSFLTKKSDMYNIVKQLLAGRAVEDKILKGDYTSGASNDLMKVNKIIYTYIVKYGMSSENENLFVDQDYGDLKSEWIQDEVKKIRETIYKETQEEVDSNFKNIELLAEYLLINKEIDQHEIIEMFEEYYPTIKY